LKNIWDVVGICKTLYSLWCNEPHRQRLKIKWKCIEYSDAACICKRCFFLWGRRRERKRSDELLVWKTLLFNSNWREDVETSSLSSSFVFCQRCCQ
jgi:hypothetical protein